MITLVCDEHLHMNRIFGSGKDTCRRSNLLDVDCYLQSGAARSLISRYLSIWDIDSCPGDRRSPKGAIVKLYPCAWSRLRSMSRAAPISSVSCLFVAYLGRSTQDAVIEMLRCR